MIRALEGSLSPVSHLHDEGYQCRAAHEVWHSVEEATQEILDGVTIGDLASREREYDTRGWTLCHLAPRRATVRREPGIADSVLDLIGNTPLVRLSRITPGGSAEVLGKMESLNPAGSVKDRIALAMIEAAEARRHAQARRHDRRADVRQHRHRPRDGLPRSRATSSS